MAYARKGDLFLGYLITKDKRSGSEWALYVVDATDGEGIVTDAFRVETFEHWPIVGIADPREGIIHPIFMITALEASPPDGWDDRLDEVKNWSWLDEGDAHYEIRAVVKREPDRSRPPFPTEVPPDYLEWRIKTCGSIENEYANDDDERTREMAGVAHWRYRLSSLDPRWLAAP